jgi:hypothetical protein
MKKAVLDIEIYDTSDPKEEWAQGKYLVHGYDDVLWTDDLKAALAFLEESIKKCEEEK